MTAKSTKGDNSEGICSTCKNKTSCLYIQNGNPPKHHCEEFEVYSYQPVIENHPYFKRKKKEDKPALNGICKNCDNRKSCMNAKPERVIWHCEEYA